MYTFDEIGQMLDNIAAGIPEELFKELNGGIVLLPNTRMHPASSRRQGLYVLGEYHNDRTGYGGLGRYIAIYYGSFVRAYEGLTATEMQEKLRETLLHEFTHHLESLAGERGLEIKDQKDIERYIQGVSSPDSFDIDD